MNNKISRRNFLISSGIIAGSSMVNQLSGLHAKSITSMPIPISGKKKIALIGTGIRGCTMWGVDILKRYSDYIEFVGLCDINLGRLSFAKEILNVSCPTFTDFEKMMNETKPDLLIVCTTDNTHHDFIIRGMELGADVLTEKSMTIDEEKIQAILDAEKRTGKVCRVTFNYRYSPHRAKIWELLQAR